MLALRLYNLPSFKRQFDCIEQLSIASSLPSIEFNVDTSVLSTKVDWNNMLGIASVLSTANVATFLDAALRISTTCLLCDTNEAQRAAACVILENLTNHPALDLAVTRQMIKADYKDEIPFAFKLQTLKSNFENSIVIKQNVLYLNEFQKKVHSVHAKIDEISISAPTSAGKSFILSHVIIENLIDQPCNIVYIVPTRALLSQVEQDLRELINRYKIENVFVTTVPQIDKSANSHVFIFTQERLHWFLTENAKLPIKRLFIDEAHKIEDGNRGILLQQKIEQLTKLNPGLKITYSSPFVSNPETLLSLSTHESKKTVVNTEFVSVNQNLIFVQQKRGFPKVYSATHITTEGSKEFGSFEIQERATTEYKKLANIAYALTPTSGGSLIYSNGAAEAEELSLILFDLLGEGKNTDSERIKILIDLVKKTVHRDYYLAKVLQRGIAFHYGNMPLLIRHEIENLFKCGEIKFLICTSTLLEGMNLPSKNIFIRKPTRGQNRPLNESDFWNLAGRAGRWGKEFSGNIICVDPTNWTIPPTPEKRKQEIIPALNKVELDPTELFDFIEKRSPRALANKRQDLEFALGYYYNHFLENTLGQESDFDKQIFPMLQEISTDINLPKYILQRNPGISPLAQQQLLNYFIEHKTDAESFIPVYPEDPNAYEEYAKLISLIGSIIADYPPALRYARSILLYNWMRGRPLNYLIQASYDSYQKNPKFRESKTLPNVIRETMDNIENFVRFRFAKDSSCYVDILRYFFDISGLQVLSERIPQMNLWLEFGVSEQTQLSLIALGVSRNTAIELSRFISSSTLSTEECVNWLIKNDFETLPVSPIILQDLKRVL